MALQRSVLLAVSTTLAAVTVGAAPSEARVVSAGSTTTCKAHGAAMKTCVYTFHYTGTMETFVVPATTAPVHITAVGAPGDGDRGFRSRGARVSGSFSGLSGKPLFITVGGEGWFDGYNGGGEGGGGGASDVRLGLWEMDHRVLVAGGGGGWGEQLIFDEALGIHRFITVKGGDAGEPGHGSGGQPGTATAGGVGGGDDVARGQTGTLGRGGRGAGNGGGGGGGLYGGGGGGGCLGSGPDGNSLCVDSQPGSGGGGSSLVPPGGTFSLSDLYEPSVSITVTQYG